MTSSKSATRNHGKKKGSGGGGQRVRALGATSEADRSDAKRPKAKPLKAKHPKAQPKRPATNGGLRARKERSRPVDDGPREQRPTLYAALDDPLRILRGRHTGQVVAAIERSLVLQSAQLASFTEERDRQRAANAELLRKLELNDANLAKVAQQLADLQAAKAATEAELAVQTARLESTADALQRECSLSADLLRGRSQNEFQIAELLRQLELRDANLAKLAQQLTDLRTAKAATEAELAVRTARLESTADALQRERTFSTDLLRRPSQNELQTAKLQIAELKEDCARYAVLLSEQRQRAAELEDERTSLAARNSDMRAKLSSELDRIVDIERALSEERDKNDSAKQRILSLEASIRLGLYETLEFKGRVAKAEKASAELASQLNALERAIDTGEARLSNVLASTSWRLTAPWRAYRRLLSRLLRVVRGQLENPLFDRTWYVAQYSDVDTSEIDPFSHYLWYGVSEGRNPNCLFDTKWYLEQNPDVASEGINPLVHFYRHGAVEGRDPHPVFSIAWHLDRISRGAEQDTNPMVTFIASLRKVSQ